MPSHSSHSIWLFQVGFSSVHLEKQQKICPWLPNSRRQVWRNSVFFHFCWISVARGNFRVPRDPFDNWSCPHVRCLYAQKWLGDKDKRKGKRKETTHDLMPLGWERWQAVAEGEVVVIALLTGLCVNKSIMRGESWNKVWELRKGKTGNAHQQ